MDSRAYIFIFPVNTSIDVPIDFQPSLQDRTFERGVFLPQDDTNWFTRPPDFPARLLLLDNRRLSIVPHPTADEPIVELALDDLVQLETGNILLFGWIQFNTRSASYRLIYNTRASESLDDFIAAVRRRWLCSSREIEMTRPKVFGQELDIKFSNLLHDSLDPDEVVLLQYFTPVIRYRRRSFVFRRTEYRPGHLIAITSADRILWLTDQHRGRCERYAGITVSAPASLMLGSVVKESSDYRDLIVNFKTGASWQFSTHAAGPDCLTFSQFLNAYAASQQPDRCQSIQVK